MDRAARRIVEFTRPDGGFLAVRGDWFAYACRAWFRWTPAFERLDRWIAGLHWLGFYVQAGRHRPAKLSRRQAREDAIRVMADAERQTRDERAQERAAGIHEA